MMRAANPAAKLMKLSKAKILSIIDNDGVSSRGQIIFPDYDPSAEPAKDNADIYYFQKEY